ncbi:MAG: FHA domain-containing protein [Saprospiraceae bacterium]|nr:FHA domain-containing protein [Saprospiraceae bacterium]
MAASTQQFKSAGSNLGQTIGQSWSMISGKDIPNYSLLFLDETLTRKRGEHETIFMPHIVLGRSSRCHVRYSDEFRTVSREHASITVDGTNFVLNHNPSASNPTYVNGKPVGGSHFLQNGDEIQLSSNGPKMRFNTSALKTSTIGLTSRIGQAMSQAVKPYKTALLVMGLLLAGAIGLAGYNMYKSGQMEKELIALNEEKVKVDQEIADLIAQGKENSAEMEALKQRKAQIIYRTNTIVQEVDREPTSSAIKEETRKRSLQIRKRNYPFDFRGL